MPRTGRPIIGNKKDVDLKVRIDDITHNKLLEYCELNHMKKAEVVRPLIENFFKIKKVVGKSDKNK